MLVPKSGTGRLIVARCRDPSTYSYVFGEGTLDPAAGTFRIQLDQAPPPEALNAGTLGVGITLVIFTTPPEQAAQYRGWAPDLEAGYGVGAGIQVPGDFDRFDPATSSSVVLIIDDLQNIEFVNWT
jgi:hypothetical protein